LSTHILLFEAVGLVGPENPHSADPFVEVFAIGENKKVVATAVVKDDLNPRWNEEYRLEVSSASQAFLLRVYHHNYIFKNVLMGYAWLYLDQITGIESGVEQRLPLDRAGELRINVRLCPIACCP
jgi:Ca2+-dependent lipid-binding protein